MIDLGKGARLWVFILAVSLIGLVPLTFSGAVFRSYSLPRFALLLVGAAIILSMLVPLGLAGERFAELRSRLVTLLCLYVAVLTIASVFGVAPYVSLFGSFENQMGLLTFVCFMVCFVGVVVGIGRSYARFITVLWVMSGSGLLISLYAVAQSAGRDPFVPPRAYTYRAGAQSVMRVVGTLGHADFLGNFLLYTTPVAAGLAFATRGRARRIAVAAVGVSIVAIAVSGTRGAWVGLIASAFVFAMLEARSGASLLTRWSRSVRAWLAIVGIVLVSTLVIAFSPATGNVATRVKSFAADRFTGSGRTILWRDSLRMAPRYALLGFGPEGFRKAFLPYKSDELARITKRVQNESSHNSYIDALVSYGVVGAALYLAVIVFALALLVGARRRAVDRRRVIALSGVLSAFAGALVHKLFIFDQIPTGLYFFAFIALAVSASNIAEVEAHREVVSSSTATRQRALVSLRMASAVGALVVGAAVWYSASLLRADVEIKRAIRASDNADYPWLLQHGERAAAAPDLSGGYHFLVADCARRYLAVLAARSDAPVLVASSDEARAAIDLGITHAEKSIEHSNSPDAAYLLLCHLKSERKDYSGLRQAAESLLSLDPHFGPAHSFLAEAWLALGNESEAEREIGTWMRLRRRGAGNDRQRDKRVQQFIARSLKLASQGKRMRARAELLKGEAVAGEGCPDCHHALAIANDQSGLPERALREWEMFVKLDPERASAEHAEARIAELKQRLPGITTER